MHIVTFIVFLSFLDLGPIHLHGWNPAVWTGCAICPSSAPTQSKHSCHQVASNVHLHMHVFTMPAFRCLHCLHSVAYIIPASWPHHQLQLQDRHDSLGLQGRTPRNVVGRGMRHLEYTVLGHMSYTWSVVSRSGIHSTRHMWTYWRELRATEMMKGLECLFYEETLKESWDCTAWRRKGSGWFNQCIQIAEGRV